MAATTLTIKILADATQAATTMDKAATRAGKFGGALRKAALPAAAVIAGLGMMGKAAAEDAQGQAVLANVLTKTTGATSKQVAATEDFIAKTALATGVADDQLRPALASLATATGDVGTSQKAMGVALDVAAATGKDVTTVAAALAKGYGGNTGALKKLVPGLDAAALKSGDMSRVMADLAKKTGGTAAKAADTAAGKMQRAAVAMDEVKESAGAALLPVLDKLGQLLGGVAKFAQDNAGAMQVLVIVFAALAAAILIANAAIKVYEITATVVKAITKLWTKENLKLAASFLANPIVLIIVAIIALVAIIVIAYKKSATFRAIVQAAWKGIQTAVAVVWAYLKTVFTALMAALRTIASVAASAGRGIVAAWRSIRSGIAAVWNWIKTAVFIAWQTYARMLGTAMSAARAVINAAWSAIRNAVSGAIGFVRGLIDGAIGVLGRLMEKARAMKDAVVSAFGAIKGAISGVVDSIKGIIQGLIDKIQGLIDKIKNVPGVGKLLGAVGLSVPTGPTPPTPPTAPTVRAGRLGAPRTAPAAATGSTAETALAALTPESQVIVQVSDRKMAQLVDVSIRASATSAARNLTRRSVVTV